MLEVDSYIYIIAVACNNIPQVYEDHKMRSTNPIGLILFNKRTINETFAFKIMSLCRCIFIFPQQ